MIRRQHNDRSARKRILLLTKKKRTVQPRFGCRLWIERLEDRYLLSANSLQSDPSAIFDMGALLGNPTASGTLAGSSSIPGDQLLIGTSAPPPLQQEPLAIGALLPTAPFPLEDTFFLHSLPVQRRRSTSTSMVHLTRNTPWNEDFNLPNILTPAFDMDGEFSADFSDFELLVIQQIWERVVEDFRPFEVNVTTQDPGVEALRNTGNGDEQWGQRVVIGGNTNDWFTPVTGNAVGGVAHGSFNAAIDDPCFVFNVGEFVTAETISHEVGHTLGLAHDGQIRFFARYVERSSGMAHRADRILQGHGTGATSWAPIMGTPFPYSGAPNSQFRFLTQWSQGEYSNANNIEGDLEIITTQNGFGYRTDDVGSTIATASPVVPDPLTADSDTSLFEGEGMIEQNTDIDFFSFTVEGLGELVSLDIQPFYNGPNLDVLAKLYDSSGVVIATSDSIDVLGATFTDQPLLPGTYYVSIQGASRPITFVDPNIPPDILERARSVRPIEGSAA